MFKLCMSKSLPQVVLKPVLQGVAVKRGVAMDGNLGLGGDSQGQSLASSTWADSGNLQVFRSPHLSFRSKWPQIKCPTRKQNTFLFFALFKKCDLFWVVSWLSHLSKIPNGQNQECTQFPTAFSGNIFHAFSQGVLHFVVLLLLRKNRDH